MDDKAEAELKTALANYYHQLTQCAINIWYSRGLTDYPFLWHTDFLKNLQTLITLPLKELQLKLCEVRQK